MCILSLITSQLVYTSNFITGINFSLTILGCTHMFLLALYHDLRCFRIGNSTVSYLWWYVRFTESFASSHFANFRGTSRHLVPDSLGDFRQKKSDNVIAKKSVLSVFYGTVFKIFLLCFYIYVSSDSFPISVYILGNNNITFIMPSQQLWVVIAPAFQYVHQIP